MVIHGHTPDDLLKSTIISIPKDYKASLTSSDNYRGISLFNSMCKLYDNVILYMYKGGFNTSDMQFAYKESHSTTLCTLIYKEVINHYLEYGSNVYSCLLDASKAFDRVHYGKLFNLLLNRNIPKCIIRLIFDSYTRQKTCTSWDNVKSEYFDTSNGVKQGGVLSAILFSLYIDPLLMKLQESGYGCHINGIYTGALSYADDITISCPSITGLNEMLKICHNFAIENNILFNDKKTVCIKYGAQLADGEQALLNGTVLTWENSVRHLGHFIDRTCSDNIDCNAKKQCLLVM